MARSHHIRLASSALEDGKRILEFTDSQLPYLADIGSGDQWGTKPVSDSEASQEKYKSIVERSQSGEKWGRNWIRAFILELDFEGEQARSGLPIAAMILEGRSSDYTRPVLDEQYDRDPFVYIRFLVTDRKAGSLSRGSGPALLKHAEEVARSIGVHRLCLDGWSGNGGKLVRYYEQHGFARLGDVDDEGWPATVMEKRLKP